MDISSQGAEMDPTAQILNRSQLPKGFGELDITAQMVLALGHCVPRALTPGLLWQLLDPMTRDEYSKGIPVNPYYDVAEIAVCRLEEIGIVEYDNDKMVRLTEKGWGCFAAWTAPDDGAG